MFKIFLVCIFFINTQSLILKNKKQHKNLQSLYDQLQANIKREQQSGELLQQLIKDEVQSKKQRKLQLRQFKRKKLEQPKIDKQLEDQEEEVEEEEPDFTTMSANVSFPSNLGLVNLQSGEYDLVIKQFQMINQLVLLEQTEMDKNVLVKTFSDKVLIDFDPDSTSIFSMWKSMKERKKKKTIVQKKQRLKTMDKAIQTQTREESCQTDPYTPPEIVTDKTDQELLKIKHFKWGTHLPPKIEELLFIEELREKTAFEGALPPISDEACFKLRRRLMQEQEIRDWENRETEIKVRQNNKINLLKNILVEREKQIEQNLKNKLHIKESSKQEQKKKIIAKIQKRKQKILRKLVRIQNKFEGVENDQSLINQYTDYSSKIYASLMRDGFSLERFSETFKQDPLYLKNYQLFQELLKDILPDQVDIKIDLQELENQTQYKYLKLEKNHLNQLKKAQNALSQDEEVKKKLFQSENYNLNIQNVKPRPLTPYYNKRIELKDYPHQLVNLDKTKMPELENKIKKQESINRSAMLLQKLLRGRAIQNLMFDGKEKRLALIEELLIVANIDQLQEDEEDKILNTIKDQQKEQAKLESVKGTIISQKADLLTLEKIKFDEEKKVMEFVEKAEEDRRNREAIETGRRQAEIILKQREQKLYEEIIKVNRNFVENFLDDTVDYSSSFLTTQIAMNNTKLREQKFQEYVQENNENYELLIRDFVQQFLIPNVNKMKLRKKIKIEEKKISQILKENREKKLLKGLNDSRLRQKGRPKKNEDYIKEAKKIINGEFKVQAKEQNADQTQFLNQTVEKSNEADVKTNMDDKQKKLIEEDIFKTNVVDIDDEDFNQQRIFRLSIIDPCITSQLLKKISSEFN